MNLLFSSDIPSHVLSGGETNPQFWIFNGFLFALLHFLLFDSAVLSLGAVHVRAHHEIFPFLSNSDFVTSYPLINGGSPRQK